MRTFTISTFGGVVPKSYLFLENVKIGEVVPMIVIFKIYFVSRWARRTDRVNGQKAWIPLFLKLVGHTDPFMCVFFPSPLVTICNIIFDVSYCLNFILKMCKSAVPGVSGFIYKNFEDKVYVTDYRVCAVWGAQERTSYIKGADFGFRPKEVL